jgi:hypothetical protein
VVLVGLSSAVPSGVGFATGQLGPAQLAALDSLLAELGSEGICRILLLHHPPLGRLIHRRRGLRDEVTFRSVVARHGAELVLSGHQHVFMVGEMPGPQRAVPVLVAPSASLTLAHGEAGGYLRLAIEADGPASSVVMQLRRFDPNTGGLVVERTARLVDEAGRIVLQPTIWPEARTAARRMVG